MQSSCHVFYDIFNQLNQSNTILGTKRSSAQDWNPEPGYQDKEDNENTPPKPCKRVFPDADQSEDSRDSGDREGGQTEQGHEHEEVQVGATGQGHEGNAGHRAVAEEAGRPKPKQVQGQGPSNYQQADGPASQVIEITPRLGNLLNRQQTCYAAAITQILIKINLHQNLIAAGPSQGLGHQQLARTLHNTLTMRANPDNPPFPVTKLVTDLNQVLSPRDQFQLGIQQCAMEFLIKLVENINFSPEFFTCFHEEAHCQVCNYISRRRIPQESEALLCVNPPHQVHHLDVLALVHALLTDPVIDMVCSSPSFCNGRQLLGTVQDRLGQTSIVWLCRNTGAEGKCLTPVLEPGPCQRWNAQECRAVVAHCGRNVANGHWIAFLKVGDNWWKMDTSKPAPILENPFRRQLVVSNGTGGSGYTIDGLIFN